MTTDNTQELDEILEMFWEGILDNPFEVKPRHNAKQAILDWHNKQVEEVLDRLEGSNKRLGDIDSHTEAWGIPLSAIEAERNKLKERDDE